MSSASNTFCTQYIIPVYFQVLSTILAFFSPTPNHQLCLYRLEIGLDSHLGMDLPEAIHQ